MQPPDEFDPVPGLAEKIAPGLRRIVAPNPSPMTYRGTNTYLLGDRSLAVIDPGPDNPAHLDAILKAVKPGQHISHIIVTHAHLDHSPLARVLSVRTGIPVFGFGPAHSGRSEIMTRLAVSGLAGGGEGIDTLFVPDVTLAEGDQIEGEDWTLEVIHTPGHIGNHICLGWQGACFTGDHIMGWASSLVSPPDGDLTDFMASCVKLQGSDWHVFYPGHGDQITSPAERLDWLIAHRLSRETAILDVLARGPGDAARIAAEIYTDTPDALLPAATRNVLAHLIDLYGKSTLEALGELTADTHFRRRK